MKRRGFAVEGLVCFDPESGDSVDATIDVSRFRIKPRFGVIFRRGYARSHPGIATWWSPSNGHTTDEVAKWLGVSAARVSQLRREMEASWAAFHGEDGAAEASLLSFVAPSGSGLRPYVAAEESEGWEAEGVSNGIDFVGRLIVFDGLVRV